VGGIDGREEHRISVTTVRATAWMGRPSYRSTAPLDSVVSEIRAVCERDATVLGKVSCMTNDGLTPREMAARTQVAAVGFAYDYRHHFATRGGLREIRGPSPGIAGNLSA